MSTQVIRLNNGDSIQVRTGVLRGSGPAGPPGPSNGIAIGTVVVGDTADATLSGDSPAQTLNLVLPRSTVPGPMGQINDFITTVQTSSNASVAGSTTHTLSFSSVVEDELSMMVNSTTFRPSSSTDVAKVINLNVRVWFMNNGTSGSGYRRAWVVLNGTTTIGEEEVEAVSLSSEKTVLNVPVNHRFQPGDTFQVFARHGGGTSLIGGYLNAIRAGAGPQGPQGPEGPANTLTIGTVSTLSTGTPATASVTGTAPDQVLNLGLPKGDEGPAGSAGSGYSEIHELDGTGGNTA